MTRGGKVFKPAHLRAPAFSLPIRDPGLRMQGQMHVSLDTSPSQRVQIISYIRMANSITFTDKDLQK